MWTLAIGFGVVSLFAGADVFITTLSDRGVPAETITVCRATGVPQHPYQAANVEIATDGSLPRDVDPARDVVPPYSYGGTNYPGVNWSSQGQAVWYAGCVTSNALAVSVTAPAQPALLAPDAATVKRLTRTTAGALVLIGVLMIALGAIAASRKSEERPRVAVSSDLSSYRRPVIRPHDSRQ